MSRRTYVNGCLIESSDDTTRKVTRWDDAGTLIPSTPEKPNPRPYTDEENAAANQAITQAAMLTDYEARIARIEAKLWPAQPDTTPAASVPTMTDYAGRWPAGALLADGGKTWRNVSGVPLTTAPSGFPGSPSQWAHLFVLAAPATQPAPPATVPAWSATASYAVGDKVTRAGVTYRCLVAHGAAYQGTWGPPLASVWATV
ncbi:MAG: carbohydrate-binding protein [Candidatus Nanopelagicales bacterium]